MMAFAALYDGTQLERACFLFHVLELCLTIFFFKEEMLGNPHTLLFLFFFPLLAVFG